MDKFIQAMELLTILILGQPRKKRGRPRKKGGLKWDYVRNVSFQSII